MGSMCSRLCSGSVVLAKRAMVVATNRSRSRAKSKRKNPICVCVCVRVCVCVCVPGSNAYLCMQEWNPTQGLWQSILVVVSSWTALPAPSARYISLPKLCLNFILMYITQSTQQMAEPLVSQYPQPLARSPQISKSNVPLQPLPLAHSSRINTSNIPLLRLWSCPEQGWSFPQTRTRPHPLLQMPCSEPGL